MGKGGSVNRPPGRKGGDGLENTAALKMTDTSKTTIASNQIVICQQTGCHDISTTHSYCRFHYLASWRKLKTKEAKRKGKELDAFLSEMAKKFPEEFLEKLKVEVEELSEKEAAAATEPAEEDKGGMFDQADGDDDLDVIIKGLKVEDF